MPRHGGRETGHTANSTLQQPRSSSRPTLRAELPGGDARTTRASGAVAHGSEVEIPTVPEYDTTVVARRFPMLPVFNIMAFTAVAVSGLLLLGLLSALVFNESFRRDVLRQRGKTKFFGVVSAEGALVLSLCGLFVGGLVYPLTFGPSAADVENLRKDIAQCVEDRDGVRGELEALRHKEEWTIRGAIVRPEDENFDSTRGVIYVRPSEFDPSIGPKGVFEIDMKIEAGVPFEDAIDAIIYTNGIYSGYVVPSVEMQKREDNPDSSLLREASNFIRVYKELELTPYSIETTATEGTPQSEGKR